LKWSVLVFSLRREFYLHEAHVSTEQCETQEDTRFSCSNGDADRPKGAQTETGQRAKKADSRGATEAGALLNQREALSQGKEGFPKAAHLTRRSEFLSLSRGGQRTHTSHFVVIRKANRKGESRLGITVSAKVGKAVVRSRIKRLVREFFRRYRCEISVPQDIVVIARPGSDQLSFEAVSQELKEAFVHGENRQRQG
jgi:ribonuclease P protein component